LSAALIESQFLATLLVSLFGLKCENFPIVFQQNNDGVNEKSLAEGLKEQIETMKTQFLTQLNDLSLKVQRCQGKSSCSTVYGKFLLKYKTAEI